jgi:hypothetical protein
MRVDLPLEMGGRKRYEAQILPITVPGRLGLNFTAKERKKFDGTVQILMFPLLLLCKQVEKDLAITDAAAHLGFGRHLDATWTPPGPD